MKKLIISGINLFEGGPLTVYYDCLNTLIENKVYEAFEITAFVHNKDLFSMYTDKVNIIEIPNSRKNYLFRLWYEYIYFYFYSRNKKIDIWFSLHDITPNVKANKRFVYCHNPMPFMKITLKSLKYSPVNFFFSLFYRFLYNINIKKNTAVIVQQDWIRNEFINMFKITSVIVAKPTSIKKQETKNKKVLTMEMNKSFKFIYPAFPRFFKNFEVICEAVKRIGENDLSFEVLLTIDGTENRYSKDIVNRYKNINNIKFIGIQSREELLEIYDQADCMIFPSKIETWGLPITEFKKTGKPMILADVPYSYETIGNYKKVSFFNVDNSLSLSEKMVKEICFMQEYRGSVEKNIIEPCANNWLELTDLIIN